MLGCSRPRLDGRDGEKKGFRLFALKDSSSGEKRETQSTNITSVVIDTAAVPNIPVSTPTGSNKLNTTLVHTLVLDHS